MARSATVTRLPGAPPPRRPLPIVSQEAVAEAAIRGRPRAERPFAASPAGFHPPQVTEGLAADAKIAQDDSAQFTALVGNWAQGAIYSSIAEGTTFLGYAALSVLAQRAEYRIMSEEIASEMTREWIELKSVGDVDKSAKIKEIEDEFKRLKVREAFRKGGALYDGFFGRGHIYLDTGDTDDRDELKMPLGSGWDLLSRAKIGPGGQAGREEDKGKKLVALRSVEPVWCYPTQYDSNDPLKPDWYNPTTWFVMGKEVHRTRLLTFIGREVPDLLKPAYSFGGLSMSQMAKPYVDNWLRTRQAVSDIVNNFSVRVLKTGGVAAALSAGGEQIFRRAEFFNSVANNLGVMLLDLTEELSNVTTPLSGLEQLQAQSQEHMASVSRIPLVKLLGIQPAGLNASSEGEIRSFYDWIKAFQEYLFRDHLHAVLGFVMLGLWGEVDREITFDFRDLWQLDEAAKVSVEKTKTDIDDANVAMGAVAPEEVRRRLATDKDSQYAGLNLDPDKLPEPPGEPSDMMGGPDEEEEGPPKTAGRIHDPRDRAENVTATAGNLPAPTGGFGDKAFEESQHPRDEAGRFGAKSGGMTTAPSDRGEWPEHIKRLKIPPAWENVRINHDPEAALQVVGRDAKGRAQYVYHPKFRDSQTAQKYARIIALDQKISGIRSQNDDALRSDDLSLREHAAVVRLIMDMGLRPGSDRETGAEEKAYGATTLRAEHVVTDGHRTWLRFVGKKGVRIALPIENEAIATDLRSRAARGGPLFPDVSDASLRDYVHSLDGGGFKTKDFRTLKASQLATEAVAAIQAPVDEKSYRKAVMEVAKKVSQRLGNTPVVALQSYIPPTTFAPWRSALVAA